MNERKQLKGRVLVVDDEEDFLTLLEKVILKKCRCDVALATSALSALEKVHSWEPEVVLTDIKMPDMDGLELLKNITKIDTTITTVIMTGYGTVEMAVQALKDGAYDFHEKPFDNEKIVGSLFRALERTQLLRENRSLYQQIISPVNKTDFIGHSKPISDTLDLLSRLATSNATVLIRGESGTGKEVASRAIHNMSERAEKKMITVNCPALPEHILESELFGYVKGAFTGADKDKDGLFLKASGSTILLDEIADIPVSVQTKLLRVLQEKEIQPLGQTSTIKVDVRVIATTNQDLEEKMERGEFREDLFYRLNVMMVNMPTLAAMTDDIPLLAHHFLAEFTFDHKREELEFSPEAMQYLIQKKWKGNIRELRNTINRATLLCRERYIYPKDLATSSNPDSQSHPHPATIPNLPFLSENYKKAKEQTVRHFTSAYLTKALRKSSGNVSVAAKESGMDRQAFQRLMRRYNIKSEDFRH